MYFIGSCTTSTKTVILHYYGIRYDYYRWGRATIGGKSAPEAESGYQGILTKYLHH